MSRLERWPLRRLWLLFGGWLLLAALGGLGSSLHFGRQLAGVTRELRAQQALLRRERRLARALPDLQQRHSQFMSDVSALEPTVAQPLYASTLVTQLGELGDGQQLTLVAVAPDRSELDQALRAGNAPRDTRHRLVATFSGRYANLLGLLEGLQQAPKALSILSLEARAQPESDDGSLVADLALLAYETPGVLPPSAELPPQAVTWIILRSEQPGGFSPAPPPSYPSPLPRFDVPPPTAFPAPAGPLPPPAAETATPAAPPFASPAGDPAPPAAEPPAVEEGPPAPAPGEFVPILPPVGPPDQGLTAGGAMPPQQSVTEPGERRGRRVWRGRRERGGEERR